MHYLKITLGLQGGFVDIKILCLCCLLVHSDMGLEIAGLGLGTDLSKT